MSPAESGPSPAGACATSRGLPPARHREASGDPPRSTELLVWPRLIEPDHVLAGRALESAAHPPRHTDIPYDAARFELDLLDRVVGVAIAPARKLVGVRHRSISVGVVV